MLKSTYQKPAPEQPAAIDCDGLPAGWTAHKAPTGHTYYYNADTKKSSWVKPEAEAPRIPIPSYAAGEFAGGFQPTTFHASSPSARGTGDSLRGGFGANGRRREPVDRPKHRYVVPACAPWVLVKTRLGRRFVHNTETNESLWRFPEDVLLAVADFDAQERERSERRERDELANAEEEHKSADGDGQSSSEYTEVEVTDSEEEDGPDGARDAAVKRQRTEEPVQDGPVEFNEDDLMAEMEEMEQDYADDGWDGEDEDPLSEEDAILLFSELLEDFNVNPFSTWDKVTEEGHIIDDPRYQALPNMRARRAAWDDWSRRRIQDVKDRRARQEKRDPRIPYLAFLQDHASLKLYWPEFKRKYRKESVMKDMKLPDKEKEKLFREHIKRLQLPQSTLKSDFTALLKSLPLKSLNKNTTLAELPSVLLTDLKYISLPPSTRDSLLETYINTLNPPPSADDDGDDDESILAKQKERQRREDALKGRERKVSEAKRKQRRDLEYGKGRLREEEMEIERAMRVDKTGLKAQLDAGKDTEMNTG